MRRVLALCAFVSGFAQASTTIFLNPTCATSEFYPCEPCSGGFGTVATFAEAKACADTSPESEYYNEVQYICEQATCYEGPQNFDGWKNDTTIVRPAFRNSGYRRVTQNGRVEFRRSQTSSPPDDVAVVRLGLTRRYMSSGYTLDGFTIDGQAYEHRWSRPYSSPLVQMAGHRATLKNNVVKNGSGTSCIRVDRPWSGSGWDVAEGAHIENNQIYDCIDWMDVRGGVGSDSHCIHSVAGEGTSIVGNTISRCSGDGVQLENASAYPGEYPPGSGWKNVKIWNNTFSTAPDPRLNYLVPGENAIDVKAGQGGVSITGNKMSGYRGYLCDSAGVCAGSGTGSGSRGEAIALHIGPYSSCVKETFEGCATVADNEIHDVPLGIVISGAAPFAALIRRNYIHDLSADAPYETLSPETRGNAIRLGNAERVRIVHNTIANTPGVAFYVDGSTSIAFFEILDNLISRSGEHCERGLSYDNRNFCRGNYAGSELSMCRGGTLVSDVAFAAESYWRPSACGQGTPSTGSYSYKIIDPNPEVIDKAMYSTDPLQVCRNALDIGAHELCP